MSTRPPRDLTQRVVLVTGGGTGIGRASAEQLIARGAKVFVTGRREEPLKALKDEHPGQVAYLTADVSKPEDAGRLVQAVVKQWGQLDVLVNNAGTGALGPLVETNDETLESIFAVNIIGLLRLCREALPALIKSKGRIINISSTIAQGTFPGAVAYGATKAAVEHATRLLAVEVGGLGVRVNAVAPGVTDTDMARSGLPPEMAEQLAAQTPLGRLGDPADVGRVVAVLATDDTAWLTGQIIQASGGFML